MYDVAIVGCGPVGATLANLLGRSGLHILVLEQSSRPFDKPRAIATDHEMLRTLQTCRLPDDLSKYIEPYSGSHYINEAGEIIKKALPLPPPFPLGWPPTATFIQPELEALLQRGIAGCEGVELRQSCKVVSVEQAEAHCRLEVADLAAVRTVMFEARYVVACDGASSSVRRALGTSFEDLQFDEHWFVVDAWLLRPTALPEISVQYCWPSRPATFVLGPRNLRRWEMKLLPHEIPSEFEKKQDILKHLSRFVDVSAIELWRAAVYRFHAVVAKQWRFGNVFLAGDAAHQSPPFAGQGLCSGIRDAANLAWKILAVVKKAADDKLLDTYEAERKPHVRALTKLAISNGRVMGELDVGRARVRDERLRRELEDGTMQIYRQKHIPGLTTGLIDTTPGKGSDGAGALFIQPRVRDADGREGLLEDFLEPEFLIASSSLELLSSLDADAVMAWRKLGGQFVGIVQNQPRDGLYGAHLVVHDIDGEFNDWLEHLNAVAAIVRPDRYVFGMAQDAKSLGRDILAVCDAVFETAIAS